MRVRKLKNKISMFLLLILLLQLLTQTSFAAEKIDITQLREQIPARWVQEYQAHGRTISVDVSPIVPEVESVPVLRVVQDASVPDISNLSSDWTSGILDGIFSIDLGDPYAESNKIKGNYKSANYYPPFDFERAYAQNNPFTLGEVVEHLETIMNDIDHGQWSFKSKPQKII